MFINTNKSTLVIYLSAAGCIVNVSMAMTGGDRPEGLDVDAVSHDELRAGEKYVGSFSGEFKADENGSTTIRLASKWFIPVTFDLRLPDVCFEKLQSAPIYNKCVSGVVVSDVGGLKDMTRRDAAVGAPRLYARIVHVEGRNQDTEIPWAWSITLFSDEDAPNEPLAVGTVLTVLNVFCKNVVYGLGTTKHSVVIRNDTSPAAEALKAWSKALQRQVPLLGPLPEGVVKRARAV